MNVFLENILVRVTTFICDSSYEIAVTGKMNYYEICFVSLIAVI